MISCDGIGIHPYHDVFFAEKYGTHKLVKETRLFLLVWKQFFRCYWRKSTSLIKSSSVFGGEKGQTTILEHNIGYWSVQVGLWKIFSPPFGKEEKTSSLKLSGLKHTTKKHKKPKSSILKDELCKYSTLRRQKLESHHVFLGFSKIFLLLQCLDTFSKHDRLSRYSALLKKIESVTKNCMY